MTSLCSLTRYKNFYFIKWKVLPNLLDYFSTQAKQSSCIPTRLLTQTHSMTSSADKPRHGQQFTPLTKFGERPSALTKLKIFRTTVEPVLIYGCDSCLLTQSVENALDDTYTRMLQKTQNMSWRHHMTNQELYGSLPRLTTIVRQRRLCLAGHVMRHDEAANKVLLWKPDGP